MSRNLELKLKAIKGTHKLFQMRLESKSNPKSFVTSTLLRSCSGSGAGSSHDDCEFASVRSLEVEDMRCDVEDDEEDDDMLTMSVKDLRELCRTHQLPLSGKKADFSNYVVAHLESISLIHSSSLENLDWILEDDALLNLNSMSVM